MFCSIPFRLVKTIPFKAWTGVWETPKETRGNCIGSCSCSNVNFFVLAPPSSMRCWDRSFSARRHFGAKDCVGLALLLETQNMGSPVTSQTHSSLSTFSIASIYSPVLQPVENLFILVWQNIATSSVASQAAEHACATPWHCQHLLCSHTWDAGAE